MSKTKKMLLATLGLSASIVTIVAPLASAQCNGDKKENKQQWDKKITIVVGGENDGWDTKDSKTNMSPKDIFIKNITKKFNDLKNADENLKNNPDVTFEVSEVADGATRLQNAQKDQADSDVIIESYGDFGKNLKTDADFNNFTLPFIGNTATLGFKWTPDDNVHYVDGSKDDPLIKAAENNNKVYFDGPQGEFPEWYKKEKELQWDGSKYGAFYDNSIVTFGYRGAIFVAGTDAEIQAIQQAWETHNYDAFMKQGIVFKKSTSSGQFILQAALIARNFNKSYDQVIKDLTSPDSQYKNYILQGKSPASMLGKKAENSTMVYHIGFVYDGDLNWTQSKENNDTYKPSAYPAAKVRVLTLTNTSVYDAIFARPGISNAETSLFMKAMHSLSIDENQLGIYTGFNVFVAGTKDGLLKPLLNVYKGATDPTVDLTNVTVPKIS